MKERQKIFEATQIAIKERLEKTEDQLQGNTFDMRNLDMDGDMMDDPLLHRLMAERIRLEDEISELKGYLGNETEVLRHPEQNGSISLGHLVHVKIRYPNGEMEETRVSLGSALDKRYLWQDEENNNPKHILISQDSPLAQALIGRKIGDTVLYQAPEGQGEIIILEVEDSPFLKK